MVAVKRTPYMVKPRHPPKEGGKCRGFGCPASGGAGASGPAGGLGRGIGEVWQGDG